MPMLSFADGVDGATGSAQETDSCAGDQSPRGDTSATADAACNADAGPLLDAFFGEAEQAHRSLLAQQQAALSSLRASYRELRELLRLPAASAPNDEDGEDLGEPMKRAESVYFDFTTSATIRTYSRLPSMGGTGSVQAVRQPRERLTDAEGNPVFDERLQTRWRRMVKGVLCMHEAKRLEEQRQKLKLCVREAWLPHRKFETLHLGSVDALASSHNPDWASGTLVGDVVVGTSQLQRFVVHPDGRFRIIWTMIAAVLILWDVLMIPLGFFELESFDAAVVMAWLSVSFWTLDLCIGLFVGFHREGVVELRPSRTVMHYLKGWFVVDATVVSLDWYFSDFDGSRGGDGGDSVGYARMGKHGLRLSRVLRTLRLLRLRKGFEALQISLSIVNSEQLIIILKLVMYIISILIVNHYIACAFYALAKYKMESDPGVCTWLLQSGVVDEALTHKYLAALHWSLTQFTPATNNIVPCNAMERLFASGVVIYALVTFSTFVSSITGAMAKLASLNSTRRAEENQLSEFLAGRQVSLSLGQRIWYFYKKAAKNSSRAKEHDVPFLGKLTVNLKMQLRTEMFSRDLFVHPLFLELSAQNPSLIAALCSAAVGEASYMSGEDIFMLRDKSTHMYLCVEGLVTYSKPTSKNPGGLKVPTRLFVAEAALWTDWTHRGRLVPETPCEILTISVAKWEQLFLTSQIDVASSFPGIAAYVTDFVRLANGKADSGVIVDDLFGMYDEMETIAENAKTAFMAMKFTRRAKKTWMRASQSGVPHRLLRMSSALSVGSMGFGASTTTAPEESMGFYGFQMNDGARTSVRTSQVVAGNDGPQKPATNGGCLESEGSHSQFAQSEGDVVAQPTGGVQIAAV